MAANAAGFTAALASSSTVVICISPVEPPTFLMPVNLWNLTKTKDRRKFCVSIPPAKSNGLL